LKPTVILRREKRDLRLAQLVLESNSIEAIREQSLKTLTRWKSQGFNFRGFDEWVDVFKSAADDELRQYMTSMDERFIGMRKSPPYVELVSQNMLDQVIDKLQIGVKSDDIIP
jgi:hypothetical protein